jgi:hypothetical protein
LVRQFEEAIFCQKTDLFELPHHQFPALSEHTKHFEPTNKMVKQYDEYFAHLSTNPLPENQMVSRIGKTSVNVKSLNTLHPGGWLNVTILTAYLDLLGNTVYAQNKEDKNPPKMAVFDSHFLNNFYVFQPMITVTRLHVALQANVFEGGARATLKYFLFFCNKIFNTISIWLSTPNNG